MEKRHYFLGIALLATIIASIDWEGEAQLDIAEPMRRTRTADVDFTKKEAKIVLAKKQWVLEKEVSDLFAMKPRTVIAPKPLKRKSAVVIDVPKMKPTAPALPFLYVGKMLEGDKATVYVSKGGRHYALTGGEVIDGEYSVIQVGKQKVTFQYMPLEIEQELIIGGES